MTQINEYPNEALTLNNGDLFDIDADIGGGDYESKKVSFGTLQTMLGGGLNLGTSDLTQTQLQRTFNGVNQRLLFNLLRRFNIELSEFGDDDEAGLNVNQQGLPAQNREFVDIRKDGARCLRVFESGRVEVFPQGALLVEGVERGGFAVGDGTLPLQLVPDNQSNAGILALFMSTQRPSIFTDILFPESPTTFSVQDSSLAWFRSTTKGVLFPNMSEIQRDAIITPETGLVIYNTDSNKMQVYTGIGMSGWSNMN
jgi:hypothetical protein